MHPSLSNSPAAGSNPGTGFVTVDGSGSEWIVSGTNFRLGDAGVGVLNLKNSGRLTKTTGNVVLGFKESGRGLIVIGGGIDDFLDNDGELDIEQASIGAAEAAGTLSISGPIQFGDGDGAIVFNHNGYYDGVDTYLFNTQLVSGSPGAGSLHFLNGVTRLASNSIGFSGSAVVRNSATLVLEQNFGATGSELRIADGVLSLSHNLTGDRAGLLRTINGDLILSSDSVVRLGLGLVQDLDEAQAPLTSDRIHVNGDLRLDGTLEITSIGNYGVGVYQIFSFGQSSTASGTFSSVLFPDDFAGTVEIDNEHSRVLLTVGVDLGDVVTWRGGDGVWSADPGSTAWGGWGADGPIGEAPWGGASAVFRTSAELGVDAGTIVVSSAAGPVEFRGMSFLGDGFRIEAETGAALVAVMGEESTTVGVEVVEDVEATIAADIIGDAGFRKTGDGLLILAGINDWKGSTTVAGGELRFGEGQARGDLPGSVAVNGVGTILSFDRSDRYEVQGVISGGGQLHQRGSGTLVLTGENTFTGLLWVHDGTLEIGNGGTSGWVRDGHNELDEDGEEKFVPYTAVVDGTLAFNRSDAANWRRTIEGTGSIVQRGGAASELTLSGKMENFSGDLIAESGRLVVDSDDYAGSVLIGHGAVLGGAGKVGSITVGEGGRLAPGNSIGTLRVAGDVTFEAGSIFEVEANASGESDLLQVTGTARLGGNVVALGEGSGWRPRTEYIILDAGSLDGEFEGAVVENFVFLDASLEYNTRLGIVTLRLDRNDTDFAGVAANPNQAAVGAALQSLPTSHPMFDRMFDLTDSAVTLAEAQRALAAVTGEIHASARNMLLEDSRLVRDALLERHYRYGLGDRSAAVWMQALAHRGEWEGKGTDTLKRDVAGLLVGANYGLGDSAFSFGWALGYHTNADVELDGREDNGETNNTHIAMVAGWRPQPESLGVRVGLAQTWHELDLRRHVGFLENPERVDSDYEGESFQAFVEVDHPLRIGESTIAPFVNLAWTRLKTDDFKEADFRTDIDNTAALKAAGQSDDVTFAMAGVRGQMQWRAVQLEGLLGYRRVLNGDDPTLNLAFVGGGDIFQIKGAPIARDAAVADLGFVYAVNDSVTLGAAYNGLLQGDAKDHAIQARLTWALQ